MTREVGARRLEDRIPSKIPSSTSSCVKAPGSVHFHCICALNCFCLFISFFSENISLGDIWNQKAGLKFNRKWTVVWLQHSRKSWEPERNRQASKPHIFVLLSVVVAFRSLKVKIKKQANKTHPMGPEFFCGWVSNRCCEACTCGLSLDDMKIKRFLNCYAGIYKILDGFPDSYNYLILSELSLSTPKPPLAKLIKIIKEVVGRLESGPSRIPNWPNNCVHLRFLFAVEKGFRLATRMCWLPSTSSRDRAELKLQTSTFLTPVAYAHPRQCGSVSTSTVCAPSCPVTNSRGHCPSSPWSQTQKSRRANTTLRGPNSEYCLFLQHSSP